MTYNVKLTALHKGLTPIYPDQDRLNFAPRLNEDIRVLKTDGSFLTFNKVRDDGTVWVVSDIEGWWNLSEPDMPDIERGFGDGSFDISGRLLARQLTFTGSVVITSSDRSVIDTVSAAVRKEILETFNLVKRGTWLVVDEDSYKRACFVRLNGKPEISVVNSRGRIDFSIALKAADPIKYEWVDSQVVSAPTTENVLQGNGLRFARTEMRSGLVESSNYTRVIPDYKKESNIETPKAEDYYIRTYDDAGSSFGAVNYYTAGQTPDNVNVSATNYGNSNVYCTFRIIGPLYGPAEIKNLTTGQTMNIIAPSYPSTQILSPSVTDSTIQYLEINTRNKEVIVGNFNYISSTDAARSYLSPLVDWIYLAPGENSISFVDYGVSTQTSYPVLQVYWRSGWIG